MNQIELDYYKRHGAALFPIPSGQKLPFGHVASWKHDWSRDPDRIDQWMRDFPDCNFGVVGYASGWIIADIDTSGGEEGRAEAWKLWCDLCASWGVEPLSVHCQSQSGGWHCYLEVPAEIDASTLRQPDAVKGRINLRCVGYTVAAGSTYEGRPYILINDVPPHPAPAALIAHCSVPAAASVSTAKIGTYGIDDVRALYEWMTEHGAFAAYESWLSAGMIARLEYGDDGLDLWRLTHDDSVTESVETSKWNSFAAEPEPGTKTLGSLLRDANALGWRSSCRPPAAVMFAGVSGETYSPPLAPPEPLPFGCPLPGACEVDGEDEPRSLSVFSAASLEGLPVPVRKWHVRDWIPGDTVTLLYGDGGTGKSLLALQLLVSTAIGRPWLNRLTETGPCLFITAEDSRQEVHIRLADVARESKVPLSAMSNLHIVSLAGEDAIIAAPEGRSTALSPTALFSAIEQHIAALRPRLVVLDTLADLFGGNEIDRSQARQFIGLLRGWALQYEVAILLLAHPSVSGMAKGTGASGSTGWNNSVRSRLYFDRIRAEDNSEPDPDARVLRSMKSNYGRIGDEIVVRWQRGIFAPDAVVSVGGDPVSVAAKAERVFVELLRKYIAQNRYVSVSEGKSSAPFIFAKDAALQGVNKKELKAAMERLLVRGVIENAPYGAPSKKMFRLYVSADAPTCHAC